MTAVDTPRWNGNINANWDPHCDAEACADAEVASHTSAAADAVEGGGDWYQRLT